MLNISNAFKQELLNDNRKYLCYADIALMDGTELNISNEDIWANGFQFEEAVSATDDFSIGSVIIGQFVLTLSNIYDKYSDYNFENADVIAYIGLELPDGTIEKIRKGTYFVDEPTYNGTTITLNCLDYLAKLDKAYTESTLAYPATLQQIVRDACSVCGMTLLTTTFDNGAYTVQERPDDDALTFREVVGYAAQIACKWVKVDVYGRLFLGWYAQQLIDRGSLDGGIFDSENPYSTGDDADGGSFNPWDIGYVMEGGTFEEQKSYHHIYSMSNMKVGTDDVVITGVQVTDSSDDEETYLYGSEGYVIAIEGNDFIQSGDAQNVATYIGNQIIGMRFRAFDISHLNDPSIESGDLVYITDRKQNTYLSMVTNTSFKVGQYQNSSCGAKSVSKNSASEFSIATKSIVKSRKEAQKQISEYDKAVQQLTSLITQSFGVYKTEEVLDDGSTIYYMHNKPTLEESQTIWKMTADAFAVSTDGGQTWNAGMDSSGNAVVNVLSAIGINFDWARGGTLTLGGQNNTNGSMTVLNASGAKIAGMDVNGILASAGAIAGWEINASQIYKVIDLYDDMSSSGLANVGANEPVQYWVWMRAPVDSSTWVFAICYKRKSDYLAGNDTVYRIFAATAAGVVTADTFNSANANITGGTLKVGSLFSVDSSGNVVANSFKSTNAEITGGSIQIQATAEYYEPIKLSTNDGWSIAMGPNGVTSRSPNGTYSRVSPAGVDTGTYSGTSMTLKASMTPEGSILAQHAYDNVTSESSNVNIMVNGLFRRSASSSRRYKTEITDVIPEELNPDKLYEITVKSFKYKDGYLAKDDQREGQNIIGFIAEEMAEVYPQAVNYVNGKPEMWDSQILIPAMMKLIQEQNNRIKKLEEIVGREE